MRPRSVAFVAGAALGSALAIAGSPAGMRPPRTNPSPAGSPAEARERHAALVVRDRSEAVSGCVTPLFEPQPGREAAGSQTPTVLLLHGFTQCPAQFSWVGEALAEAGLRALVPRKPLHGQADRLDPGLLAGLRADALAAWVDEAVDIAAGFGGPVWVLGLSGGGIVAQWAARVRPEITRVAAVAPFAAPRGYSMWAVRAAARFEGLLPVSYYRWDMTGVGSPYIYPGFAIRAASAYMRFSSALADDKLPANPNLERAVLVLNGGDHDVDPGIARRVFRAAFQGHVPDYEEVGLPVELGWGHDYIDPFLKPRPLPADVLGVLFAALGLLPFDPAVTEARSPRLTAGPR